MNKVELLEQISRFLVDSRKSDGGYAEVTTEDMQQLQDIFYKICELKFQKDADGDLPINFQVVDRNKKHFLIPQPINSVFYSHKVKSRRQYFDKLGKLAAIIQLASKESEIMTRYYEQMFEEFVY